MTNRDAPRRVLGFVRLARESGTELMELCFGELDHQLSRHGYMTLGRARKIRDLSAALESICNSTAAVNDSEVEDDNEK